jgi:predicted alpha/beta-hydrolase family hydrolase
MDFMTDSAMHNLMMEGEPGWPLFVFAHGAGAPMDSDFMNRVTELLLEREVAVARFEFPYMAERRANGKKRPPNGQKQLLDCWRDVYNACTGDRKVVVGGKSMGGRMASMIADEVGAAGLVCLGYPFHAPGKPEKTRTDHLQALQTSAVIIQGTRDAMGNQDEVGGYNLSGAIELFWLEDGNHDLKPRVKSGFTHDQHLLAAADRIARFCRD